MVVKHSTGKNVPKLQDQAKRRVGISKWHQTHSNPPRLVFLQPSLLTERLQAAIVTQRQADRDGWINRRLHMGTCLLINSCWQQADTLGSLVETSVMWAISLHEFQVGCPQPATVDYHGEPARFVTCQNPFLSLVGTDSARCHSRLLQMSGWDRTRRQAVINNRNIHQCWETSEKSRSVDSWPSGGSGEQGFNFFDLYSSIHQQQSGKMDYLKFKFQRSAGAGWLQQLIPTKYIVFLYPFM